jgi:nucleoside-diphosphate-sugar epimerase
MTQPTSSQRACLIAGCGDVGTRAGLLLAARGWRVIGLRRSAGLPAPIELFQADLRTPASLAGLADSIIDAMVYLPTPDQRTPEAYRETYLVGLENLLQALPVPPRRLLWVGSTAVHPDSGDGWQDESSPAIADTWNAVVLREAERRVAERVDRAVVLRLAGLYGPGRDWMLRRARAGQPCRSPPHWTNRIHVADAAAAIDHILELADPAPLYLGVDKEPSTDCEVLAHLARALGHSEARYADDAAAGIATGKRLSSRRLQDSGFNFRYPSFREGYDSMIGAAAAG